MPDTLSTITNLINSPPGQLLAGATLGGIVWKAFDKWENVATENDKIQLWIWLSQPNTEKKVEQWPTTCARLFDQLFGKAHLSWKCFSLSVLISSAVWAVGIGIYLLYYYKRLSAIFPDIPQTWTQFFITQTGWMLISNVLPDYFALLVTRRILHFMTQSRSGLIWLMGIVCDGILTASISVITVAFVTAVYNGGSVLPHALQLIVRAGMPASDAFTPGTFVPAQLIPAMVTSIWLWLYAGAGFVLKATRRLDVGFQWFNRHFDIEKKPLQSIGLVAGALVAVAYWAAVIVSRVV
jgi:hypothetical protein